MAKVVLIVEDDIFLQGLEATRFKKDGYDVLTAVNSVEMFKLTDVNTKIDIILLDLLLPEVDGFAILEKTKKMPNYAKTPVIVFSNLSEEKDIKRAMSLGANEFMIKSNFTLDEISAKIKDLIGV